MKILSYLLLPAIAFGMHLNTASAQTTSIDWGADLSNATIIADGSLSYSKQSVLYGDLWTSELFGPIFYFSHKSGKFKDVKESTVFNTVNSIYAQLSKATNPNTATLTALKGKNSIGKKSTYTELGTADADNLKPGIYTFDGDAEIPAGQTLTLDDGGDKNAFYIFRIGGDFQANGNLKMKSGFTGVNVFFQVEGDGAIHGDFSGNSVSNGTNNFSLKNATNITGKILTKGTVLFDNSHIDVPTDTDGDGVYDNMDDYPLDAYRAYNNDSKLTPQTIAFEDRWPHKGDFDFNDIVMKTSYNYITNAQNAVVQIVGTFTLLATGGKQKNSFHIRFSGKDLVLFQGHTTGGTLDNEITDGISFKLFDNMRDEMVEWNTIPGKVSAPKTYTLTFDVQRGYDARVVDISVDPYIVNTIDNTVREVHLPTMSPTSMATVHEYTVADDVSVAKPYITKDGLPWAISFPSDHFDYPVEGNDISNAYPKLKDWVESGATKFTDWYSNEGFAGGYRNFVLIYKYAMP